MSDQEEILPTETVLEQPPVVEEVVVEQPPVVEEVVEHVLTNEEILLDFGSLKSSQSSLIRRAAITTLNGNGNVNPTEQEINETICMLFRQHKSWEALVELDSSFYR